MPQAMESKPGAYRTSLEDADVGEISNPERTLEDAFPSLGPCALCGSSLDARHRVLDAIVDRYLLGDSIEFLAQDYRKSSGDILLAVQQWDPSSSALRQS